jgi:hypothetical protein
MSTFDADKNKEITELKKLRKLKDKKPYADMVKSLAKKYKVTERSIRGWLLKRRPGLRKSRADAGGVRRPLVKNQKKKVLELLESGMELVQVKKITGVSDRQLERIRVKNPATADSDGSQPQDSAFGNEAKELFRKLFQLDLVGPEKGITIKTEKGIVFVPKEDCEDICLILGNAFNRMEHSKNKKLKVDRLQLREKMIWHKMEEQMKYATTSKEVESLTRMFIRMKEKFELTPDIITLEKVCKELKPDITFNDIVSLIKKHSEADA